MKDRIIILSSKERTKRGQPILNNLPAQLTPLIGREQATQLACDLLRSAEVRLLTLTGAGGVGKTRLGLQVGTEMLEDFADGIYFVPLASINDPALVMPAIAEALDLKEVGEQALPDLLKAFLCNKELLLLLDNFEQVVAAAPRLSDLLVTCPKVKLLVTSRAVLHVQGEHEFLVPPLAIPNITQLPDLETLAQYAAVALFLRRAQAIQPAFQLTKHNAHAVAEICVRLDGLPLAIELAVARIKLLPPQALLARLGKRLGVLTRGTQDMPARQQTLRNTIAWSYHLLDAQEQLIFRRISIFVGGCTLEAIESICKALSGAAETELVLDGVGSLIDKSLVQQTEREGEEPRLIMLETIREYGLEVLEASGEEEITCQAHAHCYLSLAEGAEPHLHGPEQVMWFDRLEQERDNLRASLLWLLERAEDRSRIEMALRLGTTLWWFWFVRGPTSEGWAVLSQALARSDGVAVAVRAKALWAAGWVAGLSGHSEQAEALCQEGLALASKLVDVTWEIASYLEGVAQLVVPEGEPVWAARLWGAAEALRETSRTPLPPVYRADYDRAVIAARVQIGEQTFATAWAQGRGMPLEQVLATRGPVTIPAPRSAGPFSTPVTKASPASPAGLTARELEVLRLVAQGLSDAKIAERLVISYRTVTTHVSSIYTKLGVSSRSAATRFAVEHHLV
jgi:predicted ATPase/DNA-binding CsgD family transcriptional regulator